MESLTAPDRFLRMAVDLVNTRTLEPEKLVAPAALAEFLIDHGEPTADVTDDDLAAVQAVRERIRPVFHAGARDAVQILNGLLADSPES